MCWVKACDLSRDPTRAYGRQAIRIDMEAAQVKLGVQSPRKNLQKQSFGIPWFLVQALRFSLYSAGAPVNAGRSEG